MRGTRFGIGVDPRRRPVAAGGRGIPAHLDGRQSGRLGGHAAPRQGGGNQRPVVQRPAADGALGRRWRGPRRPNRWPRWPTSAQARSTGGFGTTPADIFTTWSTVPQGDDAACRPNQILSSRWSIRCSIRRAGRRCWESSNRNCCTPVGLRSLSPGHPDYKPRYDGDLRSRDAAYHQGTVWAWLIGPLVDAWLRVYPRGPPREPGPSAGV